MHIEELKKELESLLNKAKAIARDEDIEKRIAISDALIRFVQKSWPDTPEVQALDEIAREASLSILITGLQERIAAIQARSADYVRLEKQMHSEIEINKKTAADIRLDTIIETITMSRTTVESFRKLKESLKNTKSEQNIAKMIDETIASIETLRSKVGKLI